MVQKVNEEFADMDESERTKLISRLKEKIQKVEDVFVAGGSATDAKKSFLSSETFLSLTGIFIENITTAKDMEWKVNYAVDYMSELKAAAMEKKQQQENKRQKRQQFEEMKAKNEKLPPEFTKKGHAKLMAQRDKYKVELRRAYKKLDKYNREVVDLSLPEDESKYVRTHLLTKRILNFQKKIHEIDGLTPAPVPRPLRRKFKFTASGCPDIDNAVVEFMSKRLRSHLFDAPDRTDISNLISGCKPEMPAADLTALISSVFVAVCKELKDRRYAETMDVLHGYESDEDQTEFVQPELTDAELQAKLAENDKLKKDETVVLQEFEKKWQDMTQEERDKDELVSESEKDPEEEEGDEEDSEQEEVCISDDSSEEETADDEGRDDGNEHEDLEEEAKSEVAPATKEDDEKVAANVPVVDDAKVAEGPVVEPPVSIPETNGCAVKRPSPNIKSADIQSITLDDDSEDEEQPAKKMKLDHSEESKAIANVVPVVHQNGKASVVPMDWKPEAPEVDLVDLCSDED